MPGIKVLMNGAVSIVNAIATGKGATLGTSLKTTIRVNISKNKVGILAESVNAYHAKFIKLIIKQIVPSGILLNTGLHISIDSNIPIGCGLKSSSIISTGISLACNKLFKLGLNEADVLNSSVLASIKAGVSITGAYDDACGCYYGGFVVTDNIKNKIIKAEKCNEKLSVVIFIPKLLKRKKVKTLKRLNFVFNKAWILAQRSDYWNAMTLNGMAISIIFNLNPNLILSLMDKGAFAASTSGNGTSIVAITKNKDINTINKVFRSYYEGNIILTSINNNKPKIHEL